MNIDERAKERIKRWDELRSLSTARNIPEFYKRYSDYLEWDNIVSESRAVLHTMALAVVEHFATHWRDDDSPQAETTFGVKLEKTMAHHLWMPRKTIGFVCGRCRITAMTERDGTDCVTDEQFVDSRKNLPDEALTPVELWERRRIAQSG